MNTHICYYALFDSKNNPIYTGQVPVEVTRDNINHELFQKELLQTLFKVAIISMEKIGK